jgi:hypothetical protein
MVRGFFLRSASFVKRLQLFVGDPGLVAAVALVNPDRLATKGIKHVRQKSSLIPAFHAMRKDNRL